MDPDYVVTHFNVYLGRDRLLLAVNCPSQRAAMGRKRTLVLNPDCAVVGRV